MKERIKIAVALGYYARAVGEIKTLKDAIDAYALTEYRNDVDCQVAFRKGFQEAEAHLTKDGPEAQELRELVGWIARLDQDVHQQRQEIFDFLHRQAAMTPLVYGGGGAPIHPEMEGKRAYARGGGGGQPGGDGVVKVGGWPVSPFIIEGEEAVESVAPRYYLRRKDTGQLYCRDGIPVVYPTIPSAQEAIADLYVRTGIACVPDLHRYSDSNQPYQMRRVDNGELFCQDGRTVVHQGYNACMEACQYLYDNMGIHCEPSAGRPLGKEWNPPALEIKPSPELHRDVERWSWYAPDVKPQPKQDEE